MINEDSNAGTLSQLGFINLSAQLRKELELKIDNLGLKKLCLNYFDNQVAGFNSVSETDRLCTYLIDRAPHNYIVSGKLLQGVRTWFNMHYCDRLLVINKFKICYYNSTPFYKGVERRPVTVLFCKFLISELLSTLAESRWQALTDRGE